MRHSRLTFSGAYHHIMNRGDKGEKIFLQESAKRRFLELLKEKSRIYKIVLYAYCIMDNHFHLVIKNSSGKMSEFMRALDGQYAMNYRKVSKSRGYVFQDRYKSILVEEGKHLMVLIIYVLLNPVRAGLVHNPFDYRWSSIGQYYAGGTSSIVKNEFVEELFGDRRGLRNLLREWVNKEDIPVEYTRFGKVLGDAPFIRKSLQRFDRRKEVGISKRMRHREDIYELPDNLIRKFEIDKGTKIDEIDFSSKAGRKLRYELIKLLKEQAGLRYKEIVLYEPFCNLKFASLGQMYKRAKEQTIKKGKKK